MSIRNLQSLETAKSVAVIGGSSRPGSMGEVVLRNILAGGFAGAIWPVNPKYGEIGGLKCFGSVRDLPEAPEIAVIMTPPKTVPGLVRELGDKGNRLCVVITAGISEANGLRPAMLEAARPHTMRIIGPNTLGIVLPHARLNASFSHIGASAGGLALLSQSGAIATAMIDWAAEEGIGFSKILSLGDMADVDVGDLLDMLAGDRRTKAVLMYLETIPATRKFLSAARAASRIKPVIAIKSGRNNAAARAAATHTGALSGSDRVAEAAFARAGILRVLDLGGLFGAAEVLARFKPLETADTVIVTNGGGAGVLGADRLADFGIGLADLSAEAISKLDSVLPETWSKANPIDIIGDAPPERYAEAIRQAAAVEGAGSVLAMNCPTGLGSSRDAARAIASLAPGGIVGGRPLIACWLGGETARDGRELLQAAGIPTYETPGQAVEALSFLVNWTRAQTQLSRVPEARRADARPAHGRAMAIFRSVAGEGRRLLTEPEAKKVLSAYGIAVPETIVARTVQEVREAASRLLGKSPRIAVKLISSAISHKSDVGGVVLGIDTVEGVEQAAEGIRKRVARLKPDADIAGFSVQEMVERRNGHELIVGLSVDPQFGPVLLFGAGGVAVETVDDTVIGLPPLDSVLAGDMIDRTRISRLLAGYRDRNPADRAAIIAALIAVSDMAADFPFIQGVDINPLVVDEKGAVALDARIEIDPARIGESGPNRDLAIRPYPADWEKTVETGGLSLLLRPIIPSDFTLYPTFLEKVSPDDIRLRMLAPRRHFPDEMLKRLTQIDYDREMAFVAIDRSNGEMAGISRFFGDPDRRRGEFAIIVRTDLQGHGIGWVLLERLVAFADAEGFNTIEGSVLSENTRMLTMCREFGFRVVHDPDVRGVSEVVLDLGVRRDVMRNLQP